VRNISFQLTTEQIRNHTKTVTRRLAWGGLKPGDQLQACVKCMGIKKGEKIEKICVIEVTSVRVEWLDRMAVDAQYGAKEAALEGFPEMTGQEFVRMFCKHMKCEPSTKVTRIEFKYLD
jgi:hypothetical protein